MNPQFINFRSYQAMMRSIQTSAYLFKDFDVVVGVPQSGIIPAACLASTLGINFATLEAAAMRIDPHYGFRHVRQFKGWSESRILVVDDSVNNGNENRRARETLARAGLSPSYMAVYATTQGLAHVDHHIEILEYPRIFQWNILGHPLSEHACYDLDGVLCIDPVQSDKESEASYVDFIRKTPPLHLPGRKIGWIVTSRLEKFREETVQWLADHNIEYNELIMMRHADADTRQRYLLHGLFKAEAFRKLPALYFVESAREQSRIISRIAEKPCFCVEDMNMYFGEPNNPEVELVDRLTWYPANSGASFGSGFGRHNLWAPFRRLFTR